MAEQLQRPPCVKVSGLLRFTYAGQEVWKAFDSQIRIAGIVLDAMATEEGRYDINIILQSMLQAVGVECARQMSGVVIEELNVVYLRLEDGPLAGTEILDPAYKEHPVVATHISQHYYDVPPPTRH